MFDALSREFTKSLTISILLSVDEEVRGGAHLYVGDK